MPSTQVLMLPKDQIEQAKQRAQGHNATNIKEEADGGLIKLTITYPDDAKVLGSWNKQDALGGAKEAPTPTDDKEKAKKAG